MILKNGLVLDKSFRFANVDLQINEGKIVNIKSNIIGSEVIDCKGKYILPGLVDIHTHGCGGADACDGTHSAMDILSKTQGDAGVTSFLATTMTLSEKELCNIFTVIKQYMAGEQKKAAVIGINMEGPFFNEKKKGAQRGDCLKLPDVALFRKLNKLSGNAVKLVDLAPELDGAFDFIRQVKNEVAVSIAHTACDYDVAMDAIYAGAKHITHLYNAMNGFTHRNPGPIAAACDTNIDVELISDGIHINPAVIRATFKMMRDRVCLISDSMSAAGMPNGEYSLGGQKVFVKDKMATLSDGTIAGSATNLYDCMKKAVEFGISIPDAVKAASYNPSKSIGMEKRIGSLDVGLDADILITDTKLNLEKVFFKGIVK